MKPNMERLKKLLAHMESGKLSVDKFDFRGFHFQFECGTAGCMGGECVFLWPNDWMFGVLGHIHLKGVGVSSFGDLRDWFGLAASEVSRLFYPTSLDRNGILPSNATREQATANLRAFIAEQEAK